MFLSRFSGPKSTVTAAVTFVAIGLLALWLGGRDALGARNAPYRLLGLMFVFAAVLLLGAAVLLARPAWRETWGRVGAVLACGAGVFVGGALCFLQGTVPVSSELRSQLQFALWAVVVVASGAALLLAWTPTAAPGRIPFGRVAGGLTAVGVTGAAIWGGVNWWYQNQYLPGTASPTLTVSTKLKEQLPPKGQSSDMRIFRATATIKNTGDIKVQVVSSSYQVTREITAKPPPSVALEGSEGEEGFSKTCFWRRYTPAQGDESKDCGDWKGYKVRPNDPQALPAPAISRFTAVTPGVVLAYGRPLEYGEWFEAGAAQTVNILARVPNDRRLDKDDLRFRMDLVIAKGERLALNRHSLQPKQVAYAAVTDAERENIEEIRRDDKTFPHAYPHRYLVSAWEIEPLGAVQRILTGPPQSVGVMDVLQARACIPYAAEAKGKPNRAATENACSEVFWDSPSSAVCISSADWLAHPSDDEAVYRDPTRICPLTVASGRAGEEAAQEQEKEELEKGDYYGLNRTTAQDVISLRPSNDRPEKTTALSKNDASSTTSWLLQTPPEEVDECGPAVKQAGVLLASGRKIESALLDHKRIMDRLDRGEITSGQAWTQGEPSAKAGTDASAAFVSQRAAFDRKAKVCREKSGQMSGALMGKKQLASWPSCRISMDAAQVAVRRAAEVRVALDDHVRMMGKGFPLEQSQLPLLQGQSAAQEFDRALEKYWTIASYVGCVKTK